jgi:hypothetical protein
MKFLCLALIAFSTLAAAKDKDVTKLQIGVKVPPQYPHHSCTTHARVVLNARTANEEKP